jgi:threonine/homoserine/homoserine lactone efflux protein
MPAVARPARFAHFVSPASYFYPRMLLSTWIAFVIAGVLIAISPGSGAVLSMSHGLAYGLKKASATVLGLQLGLILVLVVAGAGVGSLVLASDAVFTAVKIAGALYLIWLGIGQWRSKPRRAACRPPAWRRTPRSASAC